MADEVLRIDDDKVVTFHYSLRDSDAALIESSEGKDPVVYMHGHDNIVPGLESEMTGKTSGEKFTATVAPEKAYGATRPERRAARAAQASRDEGPHRRRADGGRKHELRASGMRAS